MIILLILLLSHRAIITNQVRIPIEKSSCMQDENYNEELSSTLMNEMNDELLYLRRIEANVKWNMTIKSSFEMEKINSIIIDLNNKWKIKWCRKFQNLTEIYHNRMIHLLCKGPIYTPNISKKLSEVEKKLSLTYSTTKICKNENQCFYAEPDLEKFMSSIRNETELRWMWEEWQNKMSHLKNIFTESVILQNLGARNNNYEDFGEYLREEFEIPDLKKLIFKLYNEIRPLYKLLHAFVRYKLVQIYPEILHPKQSIFSHLLGNSWSQNWSPLIKLVLENDQILNITHEMLRKNYNIHEMVKKAEDFYLSLGFSKLSEKFWKNSIFERKNETINCHATAVNMYIDNDFRILACLKINIEDFEMIIHEIGHIQYYMAYKDQPTIFRNSPNSAFHEAIGDTILLGLMAPQNLQRLGLVKDFLLVDNIPILLKQALFKLPVMIHSLIMDFWRWQVYSGKIKPSNYNRSWWKLYKKFMGIKPPSRRSEIYFDPAALFHITENVPTIRYFLSTILQFQFFETICRASVTGKIENSNLQIPLHQCDIYGSQEAGKILRSLMQLGSSVNWKDALYLTTESTNYETKFLLNYFQPLSEWLQMQIDRHNIPVGWD
ncbi:angiotensin-converting enzyme-like [Leptopilina boulardi]|uniref:angiotensin-converting enzyme-like n=1 Tax=Leptopilina boulardi TaxID=63433 RepID=UPI0021F673C9|nr:angiotensin-converting enzyme-like [Leptopilina boulardi]